MNSTNRPLIVQAAQSNIVEAAKGYAALGMSVIPLKGKRPALNSWTQYQQRRATPSEIETWHKQGLLQNIGIVCGAVSGNLVVLDLDGAAGYPAFAASFPQLAETYTVATGGGVGKHVYFHVDTVPPSVKAMNTPIGNLELCGEGRQVVAPPSVHPITGQPYRVEKACDIAQVSDLAELVRWIEAFKLREVQTAWKPPSRVSFPTGETTINPRVLDAIAHDLLCHDFKQHGDWLHGRCIHPERHKNGDRNPSFGFNVRS